MTQSKFVKLLFVVLLFALLLPTGVFAQTLRSLTIEADGVDVNRRILYLDYNDSVSFDIVTNPDLDFARTDIVVRSSNENIAAAEYDGSGSFQVNTRDVTGNVTVTVQDRISRKSAYVRMYVQKLTESISIYGEEEEVYPGKNIRLYAEAFPEEASNRRILWYAFESGCDTTDLTSCTASRAASVASTGVVTGKQVNEETPVDIVVCPVDGGAECETYAVTVRPVTRSLRILDQDENDVTSQTLYMDYYGNESLTVKTDPEGMEIELSVRNSNISVAEAEAAGDSISVSSFDRRGSATITARDEISGKSATVRITVQSLTQSLEVEGESEVFSGQSIHLRSTVEPSDAANKNIIWRVYESGCNVYDVSSCTVTNAAIISGNGTVTGRPVDEATDVTVVACPADGGAPCVDHNVTVKPVLRDIIVKDERVTDEDEKIVTNSEIVSVLAGEPVTLTAESVPEGTETEFTWKSSSERVVTVDNGVLTGHQKGIATVTVFSANTRVRKAVKVRVIGQLVEDIEVVEASFYNQLGDGDLLEGKSVNLKAIITPSNADVRNVVWSVSCADESECRDGEPATVSNGKVTAVRVNKRTEIVVTATAADGSGVSGEYRLWVAPKARALRIVDAEVLLTIPRWGDDFHFHAPDLTDVTAPIIKKLNTTEKYVQLAALLEIGDTLELATDRVIWSSSNRRVADVDSTGRVTFYNSGTVTITARTNDGSNLSRSATVQAMYVVENIVISGPSNVLGSGRSMQLTAAVLPTNALNKRLRWFIVPEESTNLHAATINEVTGVITAAEVTQIETVCVMAASTDVDDRNQPVAVSEPYYITIYPLAKSLVLLYQDEIINGTTLYADVTNDTTLQVYSVTYPETASQEVNWASNNPRVATVDSEGVITLTGVPGSTQIRAVAKDGSNVVAVFTLQVIIKVQDLDIVVPVNSRLEPSDLIIEGYEDVDFYRLRSGITVNLTASVIPVNASNKNIRWYVENLNNNVPSIVYRYNNRSGYSISPNFTVTGADVNELACSVIYAEPADSVGSLPDKLVDKIGICVFPSVKAVKIYKTTGVDGDGNLAGDDLTGQTVYMAKGDVVNVDSDIFARNYPDAAYQSGWVWASSNQNILFYDDAGSFVALHEGTVNLAARAIDGTNAYAAVRVNIIDFDKFTEEQLAAILLRENAIYLGNSSLLDTMTFAMNNGASGSSTDSGAFAITGSETAKPGESVALTVSGVTEGHSVFWFSSNESVASVDGNGTVVIAANAAADSVVTITAAMDDENTTFTTHDIKVSAADAVQNTEAASAEELTAEAIENGDINSLVALLLAENPEEPAEVTVTSDPTEVAAAEQPAEVTVTEEPTEVVPAEQPAEVTVTEEPTEVAAAEQPAEITVTEEPAEVTDVTGNQQDMAEPTGDYGQISEEPQTVSEEAAPAVETITVDVEDDLITVTSAETFTLESWKLSILPAEADWNTLTFEVENETVAELESDEAAKIFAEGLKIKALAAGETKLVIKSGDVEKTIRIVVLPAVAIEPAPATVEPTPEETNEDPVNGDFMNSNEDFTGNTGEETQEPTQDPAENADPFTETETGTDQPIEEPAVEVPAEEPEGEVPAEGTETAGAAE